MISIVIRTRNEESWIGRCLEAVFAQDHPDFEVLLVDNESDDRTLEIASRFECRVLRISRKRFTFGRALNLGFENARGEFVAALSGHCVPVNDHWLLALAAPLRRLDVAGCYGRQLPLPDSDPIDKRDLWTTFGIERRMQAIDYFFHNANSIVRRSVWSRVPFDEEINGVEDRHWAKKVLARGYRIAYEPAAAVFHHHGIHHGRDPVRAERVVRVIESIHEGAAT